MIPRNYDPHALRLLMQNDTVPTWPLPPPSAVKIALVGSGNRAEALASGLEVGNRICHRLRWDDVQQEVVAGLYDVVVVADSWRRVHLNKELARRAVDGAVVLAAVDVIESHVESAGAGIVGETRVEGPPEGTTMALATAWPESRIVGAFHQLSTGHLALAAVGGLSCDVPIIGDDREAVDLCEGVIDEMVGLEAVYAGPLSFARVVEGFSAIVHDATVTSGRPVGFQFTEAGLKFTDI